LRFGNWKSKFGSRFPFAIKLGKDIHMRSLCIALAASIVFASPAMACCGGDKQSSAKTDGKSMCMKGMDHSKMGEAKAETPKADPHAGMDMGDAPKAEAPAGEMKKAGCCCCSGMHG
jgi:uncharacterized protein involved in copper resistance